MRTHMHCLCVCVCVRRRLEFQSNLSLTGSFYAVWEEQEGTEG